MSELAAKFPSEIRVVAKAAGIRYLADGLGLRGVGRHQHERPGLCARILERCCRPVLKSMILHKFHA